MSSFSDPKAIVDYAQNATRRVPGLSDIHRMSALLLAERTPPNGRVLVVGAGGGMELTVFAQSFPGWHFDGVDPSAEMLGLAKTALGPLGSRVQLHHGYIEAAPMGPFDAACCICSRAGANGGCYPVSFPNGGRCLRTSRSGAPLMWRE